MPPSSASAPMRSASCDAMASTDCGARAAGGARRGRALRRWLTGAISLRTERRALHHDHAGLRADGVLHSPSRCRPMAATTASRCTSRSTRVRRRGCSRTDSASTTSRSACWSLPTWSCRAICRLALRPRAARRAGESAAGARRSASTPIRFRLDGLCHRRACSAAWPAVLLANQTEFVVARLHVLAALGRTAGHGHPRRHRHAVRRDPRRRAVPAAGGRGCRT